MSITGITLNIASKPSIFICEFITAGGFLGQPLPENLATEGLLMRDALIADLNPYADVMTTHDDRVPSADCQHSIAVNTETNVNQIWQQQIQQADAVWIIAPETDGILFDLTELASKYNQAVIGSDLHAIKTTSSKQSTYAHLSKLQIPVVHTRPYKNAAIGVGDWLIKPDDGVGAEGVVVGNIDVLSQYIQRHDANVNHLVIQPFISGIPASISVFSHKQSLMVLSYNLQHIENKESVLYYRGGILNGARQYQPQMDTLAANILSAMPGLQGYWGIDVMIDPNSKQLTVIEINPRLTTSYIKLKEAMAYNPAKLVLDTLRSGRLEVPKIEYKEVAFHV